MGARIPLYHVGNGRFLRYKGDRRGIGFVRTLMSQEYTEYEINVSSDTKFCLLIDGILDQDGEDGTRFGEKRLEVFLLIYHNEPFSKQYDRLQNEINVFAGTKTQLDDATMLGFKFI